MQDGGMRVNKSIEAALSEISIIWPGCEKPDVVVSVRTGTAPSTENGPLRGILVDGFNQRLIRGFMPSPLLDGEQA